MKRIIALFVSLILVCACCVIQASAESFDLIPGEGTSWTKQDNGGVSVSVEYKEGETVFSGSIVGTWPAVEYHYETEERITANIDEYSIVYDFSVSGGAANINFYFTDGFGSNGGYTIANNTLGNISYDPGSGDLYDGDFKGVIKLSDFVESTKFLGGETFPANMITADGEIIFSGIQFYSVSGGIVTVRKLAIVPNEEAGDPTGGNTTEESSVEAPESSVEATESSEAAPESETESTVESSTESATESATESTEESVNEPAEEEGLGVWLYVIIGAAVVVVIAVIVVIAKKKK